MKKVLPLGKFYGTTQKKLETKTFTFVEMKGVAEKYTPIHTHQTAHFVFILNGSYEATVKGKKRPCSPSTILYHPFGTTHRDHIESESGGFLTVSLSPKVNKQLLNGITFVDYSIDISHVETSWLRNKIHRELSAKDTFSEMVLEGLANELLAYVARRSLDKSNKPPKWLKMAYEIINDRCTEEITISKIADVIGVHPIHLARTFRRFFNCSPGEYLRKCRIDFASNLLLSSDKSLSEIAIMSGFADQSQFTRSFRRNIGITPQRFRKAHNG